MNLSVYDKLNTLEDEVDNQERLRDSMEEISDIDDDLKEIYDEIGAFIENWKEKTTEEISDFFQGDLNHAIEIINKIRERLY